MTICEIEVYNNILWYKLLIKMVLIKCVLLKLTESYVLVIHDGKGYIARPSDRWCPRQWQYKKFCCHNIIINANVYKYLLFLQAQTSFDEAVWNRDRCHSLYTIFYQVNIALLNIICKSKEAQKGRISRITSQIVKWSQSRN